MPDKQESLNPDICQVFCSVNVLAGCSLSELSHFLLFGGMVRSKEGTSISLKKAELK